jgi:hypothetical protein
MTSGAACKAVCVLMSDSGNNVLGYLTIAQPDVNQPVKITGNLTGLTPGKHGISVCVSGDASLGASTCGAIFNPFGMYIHRVFVSLIIARGSVLFVREISSLRSYNGVLPFQCTFHSLSI